MGFHLHADGNCSRRIVVIGKLRGEVICVIIVQLAPERSEITRSRPGIEVGSVDIYHFMRLSG
jgi:hypothetical protein